MKIKITVKITIKKRSKIRSKLHSYIPFYVCHKILQLCQQILPQVNVRRCITIFFPARRAPGSPGKFQNCPPGVGNRRAVPGEHYGQTKIQPRGLDTKGFQMLHSGVRKVDWADSGAIGQNAFLRTNQFFENAAKSLKYLLFR